MKGTVGGGIRLLFLFACKTVLRLSLLVGLYKAGEIEDLLGIAFVVIFE